jgi:hypothetical protein
MISQFNLLRSHLDEQSTLDFFVSYCKFQLITQSKCNSKLYISSCKLDMVASSPLSEYSCRPLTKSPLQTVLICSRISWKLWCPSQTSQYNFVVSSQVIHDFQFFDREPAWHNHPPKGDQDTHKNWESYWKFRLAISRA